MRTAALQVLAIAATALLLSKGFLIADGPEIKKILPASTVVYLEMQPLESVLEHPFTKTLQGTAAFKKLWRSPNVLKLRGGITLFEFAMGDTIDSLAKNLSAQGLHVAIDKKTEGVVLLAHSTSKDWLEEYLQKVIKLVRDDAKSKKQPDPIREADYRGMRGYEFQKVVFGNIGPLLIVTNKGELGKNIFDRYLDSPQDHLLSNPTFQKAWPNLNPITPSESASSSEKAIPSRTDSVGSVGILKAFVDIDPLRKLGIAKDLLKERPREFPVELILGGVLASLQQTPYAMGAVRMSDTQIATELSIPYEKKWTQDARGFFVGPESDGHASRLVEGNESMASLMAYRDLAELWRRAGDLFDQKVNDQLAQADNTLTTLFSGKDFGTDILGAIEPQIQLVAAEQAFEKGAAPAIQLPSFGLVAKLKDRSMQKGLKRTFQSFIGFLNVAGAMEGNPQLDLESETIGSKQIHSANYLVDSDKKYENGLPIQFNFSPTLAFDEDLIMITSTSALSKALVKSKESLSSHAERKNNTEVQLNLRAVKRSLQLNRQQMVSQNMLEKGHSKTEAETEIDTLLQLLSLVSNLDVALRFNEFVRLDLNLELETGR